MHKHAVQDAEPVQRHKAHKPGESSDTEHCIDLLSSQVVVATDSKLQHLIWS